MYNKEIKLNSIQEQAMKNCIMELLKNEKLSVKLQKYFIAEEIMMYIREGFQFYSDEIDSVNVNITNDMDDYTDQFKITKDNIIITVKTNLIHSFKNCEFNYNKLRKGSILSCELVGQEIRQTNETVNKLDELVYVQLMTIKANDVIKKNLSIVFYIKERGEI